MKTLEVPVMHTGLMAEMHSLADILDIEVYMEIVQRDQGAGVLCLKVDDGYEQLLRGALLAKGYRPT